MLVNRTGTGRTGAQHERRTVTVAVQIQGAVTFVAATALALLFHHHASPLGSGVLEPHLDT